jgi:hypothetical protein
MILTKQIKVKITEQNMTHFEGCGYEIVLGQEILIPVELLTSGSHHRILCKCDVCGIEKEVIYKNYLKYDVSWGEYNCRKCSEKKRKESLIKSHGVEYPIQNQTIKKKILSGDRGKSSKKLQNA